MKKILLITTSSILAAASSQAAVLYQDVFMGDGLATNVVDAGDTGLGGIGGGLVNNSITATKSFDDNGNLQYVSASGTNYQQRALVYTSNTFQSTGGFKLTVDSFMTSRGGASGISFGLVSDDTDMGAYSGFHPFTGNVAGDAATTIEGFGVNADNQNFYSMDGSFGQLLGAGLLPLNQVNTVVMSIVNNGTGGANWSWSVNGVDQGAGTITSFDFTENYQFVAYGQDDQGNKNIRSVTLESTVAVPEPSSTALLGLGGLALIMRRRK
ncbi:PEP-CTERM sorting domain-containing protein [Rubritalea spongiae]|uniref:PEP-CTERM sorting domain-containing protein n=1 Tax=Rubritalea spongiae TaxID=430797 RepID=A0ABW5E1L0_9BACT